MLGIAVVIALYLIRVGGDPRHYRYLAFSFCLATAALARLVEHALRTFVPAFGGRALDRAEIHRPARTRPAGRTRYFS